MGVRATAAITETETTLRLIAGWRQTTLHELQALERIGSCRMVDPRRETVRDSYLDTPGRKLRKARFALRIRKTARETLMTLKGPSSRNPDGSRSRLEIELPWTAENTVLMFRELQSHDITLRGDRDSEQLPSRKDLLNDARLTPFQERVMIRETRDLVKEIYGPDPFAEMVIDQVAYSPGGVECRHSEMEVELKPEADPGALEPVTSQFLKQFEGRLVLWLHGKLTIGLALEKLVGEDLEPGLLDEHNWLTEAAYERIRETLKR